MLSLKNILMHYSTNYFNILTDQKLILIQEVSKI